MDEGNNIISIQLAKVNSLCVIVNRLADTSVLIIILINLKANVSDSSFLSILDDVALNLRLNRTVSSKNDLIRK